MARRPNTKSIQRMIDWFTENGIHLYSGNANLATGQRGWGQMDIDTAEEVLLIHKHNKAQDWKAPEY